MTEELMYAIQRFIVGYKNTAKCSIIYGRRKIDNPSIIGKGTKPILRAWRLFEEYTKRTEEMEHSSAFRSLLKSKS